MSDSKGLHEFLEAVLGGKDLTVEQMSEAVRQIMTGQADDIVIAAFLIALRMKGESGSEIQGAVEVMRELVLAVDLGEYHEKAIDIVGTGGDGSQLFNVSTASAMVVAAAGGYVAKHGSRGLSSKSGSADLLEQGGANLDIAPENIPRILEQTNFCFMFAPFHHKAMKYVAHVRTTMAQRTIFNVLGPMTNPAKVKKQLMGCYAREWLEPLARVLSNLGSEHVIMVHSNDGLDEVSLAQPTRVVEIVNGEMTSYDIKPEDAGIASRSWEKCKVSSAEESYSRVRQAFAGEHEDIADFIALNAGLGLKVAGIADSFVDGVEQAKEFIAQGKPAESFDRYVEASQRLARKES